MCDYIQLSMAIANDKVNQMMNLKPSTKEYMSLRKELTEYERVLLKKLLGKRSDTAYKLKRSANKADGDQQEKSKAEPIKSKVSDNDLCNNVKIIKGMVSQMLNIMQKTNQHKSIKSSPTVTPKTEELMIDSYSTDDDNLLNKFEITVNRNH